MDKDTLIVTDHRKQNNGRGLIIGGALAILAGMYIIDKSSTCYTATDPFMKGEDIMKRNN